MRRLVSGLALLLVADTLASAADPLRMVVADAPYARVWAAAQEALRDYPIERLGDGEIVTGWRDRVARVDKAGFRRVAERVTLRVQAFEARITRLTVVVDVRGWRPGDPVPFDEGGCPAHEVLERVRAALR
jgi:uncharacterized lipoprotein